MSIKASQAQSLVASAGDWSLLLLSLLPSARGRGGVPPLASVRGYRARQAAQHAKALARGR